MDPILLIPAYKPDHHLENTVKAMKNGGFACIVVVDDGGGEQYRPIFERVAQYEGVTVVTHAVNLGKGRAIKTGFNFVLDRYPQCPGVITCDGDGQHPVDAAVRVAKAMGKNPDHLVLGVRRFLEGKKVPVTNLLGNMITRGVFLLLSGLWFSDTQCGLRGYPVSVMKAFMESKGERYEFENTTLLDVRKRRIQVTEVPMEAIYLGDEQVSHFNKLYDSARIYKNLLPFAGLPLLAALVSILLYNLLLPAALPVTVTGAIAAGAGGLLMALGIPGIPKALLGLVAGTAVTTALVFLLDGMGLSYSSFWVAMVPAGLFSYYLWLWLKYDARPTIQHLT